MSKTQPDPAQIEESFHDAWASTIDLEDLDIYAAFSAPTAPEYRFALQLLGDLQGKRLLEVGCGAGEATAFFAQRGAQVTAIDISGKMVDLARSLVARWELQEQVRVQKMAAEDLQFAAGEFDLVFGNSVLHHVAVDRAAAQIARVLKPEGKAVFLEPLAYNPVIDVYRRLARQVRTVTEHPLTFADLALLRRHFVAVEHHEFQLFTLAIFLWFFLGERVHPGRVRYWKKFIQEGERYAGAFNRLYALDRAILPRLTFLRRLCWVTVIECRKAG